MTYQDRARVRIHLEQKDRHARARPAHTRLSSLTTLQKQDVDGRDEPGHDGIQTRYCLVMISPSLELSAMNSWMKSCTPCWKMSSMWLCSRRLRTPRAWRCAAPWRP